MPYLQTWTKAPNELITVAFEFAGKLPADLTLASAVVAATEVPSGADFSAGGNAVIGSPVGSVNGTRVAVLLKNGTSGRRYRIDVLATLSDTVTKIPARVLLIVQAPTARNP